MKKKDENKNNKEQNNKNKTKVIQKLNEKLIPTLNYKIRNPIKFKDSLMKPNKFNDCFKFFDPLNNSYTMGIFKNNNIKKNFTYQKRENNNKFNLNNLNKNNIEINENDKKDNSFELCQESSSYISTTSDGGEHCASNNCNNNSHQDITGKIENSDKNDKNEEIESIKKAFKDISNYFNFNQCNHISLPCYYYCDIEMNAQRENDIISQIKTIGQKCEKKLWKK